MVTRKTFPSRARTLIQRAASSTIALVALLVIALAACSISIASASPKFSLGTQESSKYIEAEAISSPEPEIPAQLHEEGFKSFCVARFVIGLDGKSKVTLVATSGSQQADEIALRTLERWKFKPATLDGKPVQSTRKVRVEFEIQ